jgi:adenylate cyclase
MIRALVFYAASVGLLTLFGCEVCPYIESLGKLTLAAMFTVFFSIALLMRPMLTRSWVTAAPQLIQPRRQFMLDFGSFLVVGAVLTVYDRIVYAFPISSGMKALLGATTVGIFFGADSALWREREIIRRLTERGETLDPGTQSFSLTRKFVLIALGTLALMAADLAFLSRRDLQQLAESAGPLRSAQGEVVAETVIALAFFFPLTINLILSFAKNLRLFLENQRKALEQVAAGKFDVRVPVASSDEFGAIAQHTNKMIDGLREREQMRDLFGKLVSPAIAQRLLTSDGLRLGGSRRKVVVLFSDVRNFTSRTEAATPEVLVADLNRYFGRMVDVVHAHGGIVDKFIGDGMMAIFGLEKFEDGADASVRAAAGMLEAVKELNTTLTQPLSIGIGIHAGEVVAGTIGSPARLEFTFIGDTVNVAARIESLTKPLRTALLISEAVRGALSGELAQWKWNARGAQELKGRTAQMAVFSLESAELRVSAADDAEHSGSLLARKRPEAG